MQHARSRPLASKVRTNDGDGLTNKTMKIKVKSEKLTEPLVSIGTRGTALVVLNQLPAGVKLGENAQLPKSGKDEKTSPWLMVKSWVSPRPLPFVLLPVSVAVKRKLVQLRKGVKWVQTATGKTFIGDALFPRDWKEGQKLPQSVAVICKAWPSGRVEHKAVNEPPGKDGRPRPSRNRLLVGKFA